MKEKMKILFLFPNFATIGGDAPVGIASLSAAMKKQGFQFDFFDTSFILHDVVEEDLYPGHQIRTLFDLQQKPLDGVIDLFLSKFNPGDYDILLVSSLTSTHEVASPFIRLFKENNPEGFVVVGGVHPTVAPEEVIAEKGVDAICIGEGEDAIVELLSCIAENKEYRNVGNFWFKNNGKIIRNKLRSYSNLDDLTLPDYSIFDDKHFYRPLGNKIYRQFAVEISRGCPFRCSYCVNEYLQKLYSGVSKHHRVNSVSFAIDKLSYIKEEYKAEFFRFVDESFTVVPSDYFEDLARQYKEKVGLPFWIQTNASTLDEKKVSMLKEMNCAAVTIGAEHGNEEFRKNVLNKNVSDAQMYNAMALLKKYQIRSAAYFMLGLPFETRELVFDTIRMYRKFLYEYGASPSAPQCFYPFPGTKLFDTCKDKGYITKKTAPCYSLVKPGLDMPQLSYDEIFGLKRTFFAYSAMDEKLYPIIKLCEPKNEYTDKILNEISDIFSR